MLTVLISVGGIDVMCCIDLFALLKNSCFKMLFLAAPFPLSKKTVIPCHPLFLKPNLRANHVMKRLGPAAFQDTPILDVVSLG